MTIHLVLSGRTKGLISSHELSLMKPTARLVNTSRSPIVDQTALIEGAALPKDRGVRRRRVRYRTVAARSSLPEAR